jgi:radical SAM superfamily enzyme
MADAMSRAGVDMVKVHHLHLVRGTALADEYLKSPFPLLTFDDYADLVSDFVDRLAPDIVVERLFGEAPGGMLVAPDWKMDRNQIMDGIRARFEERDVVQGSRWKATPGMRDYSISRTMASMSSRSRMTS